MKTINPNGLKKGLGLNSQVTNYNRDLEGTIIEVWLQNQGQGINPSKLVCNKLVLMFKVGVRLKFYLRVTGYHIYWV